jgi:hypothetical protein
MRCVAGLREARFPFRVVRRCRARREDGATVTLNCGGRRVGKTPRDPSAESHELHDRWLQRARASSFRSIRAQACNGPDLSECTEVTPRPMNFRRIRSSTGAIQRPLSVPFDP